MKKRIVCIFFVCVIVFLNLTMLASAQENQIKFPHAIAYSKASNIGLEKRVSALEVIEYETGRIIVDTNIDKPYNAEGNDVILMAVYTALSSIKTDSIKVAESAVTNEKNNTLGLKKGMDIAVVDAVAAALLCGDENAVNSLALAVCKSMSEFVEKMNVCARYYGMTHSKYTNVSGKADKKQVTSVSDMMILAYKCYNNQIITDITSSETYYIKTGSIASKKKSLKNTFELVDSTSEFFNRSIFGIGKSKDSKGITTSISIYITAKQKFIIVARSNGSKVYNDIVDILEFAKKNYALVDVSKIIFEMAANTTVDIGGEKVSFTPMKNTVSHINIVANMFYSKSVLTLNDAYKIVPPDELPESVSVGDVINNFKVLYKDSQISTISLAVKAIGEEEKEEKTLGFTIYQPSDVQIQEGSFLQEHSWIVIVGIVILIGMAVIIGVNNIRNI